MDYIDFYRYGSCNQVNINNEPVERRKSEYRYSYEPFVVWKGNYEKTDKTVYSDRLLQWDYYKFNRCCMEVWNNQGQDFYSRNHVEIEKFLTKYFNKEIKLTGIEECCNVSNGYPYWIFYYRDNTLNKGESNIRLSDIEDYKRCPDDPDRKCMLKINGRWKEFEMITDEFNWLVVVLPLETETYFISLLDIENVIKRTTSMKSGF